jgi:hypothetical protein
MITATGKTFGDSSTYIISGSYDQADGFYVHGELLHGLGHHKGWSGF